MKEKDDNDWGNYTKEYMFDIIKSYRDKENDFFISPTGVEYVGGGVIFKDNIHPIAKEIYSTAYRIKPKSILECGSGGGYNLKNLKLLLPEAKIRGFDISEEQISFGMWFSGIPQEEVAVMDITKYWMKERFEFVFTLAVVMHLSTDNAIKALKNLKKSSSKYIFLAENPDHHGGYKEWMDMVESVFGDWTIVKMKEYTDNCLLITNDR